MGQSLIDRSWQAATELVLHCGIYENKSKIFSVADEQQDVVWRIAVKRWTDVIFASRLVCYLKR